MQNLECILHGLPKAVANSPMTGAFGIFNVIHSISNYKAQQRHNFKKLKTFYWQNKIALIWKDNYLIISVQASQSIIIK